MATWFLWVKDGSVWQAGKIKAEEQEYWTAKLAAWKSGNVLWNLKAYIYTSLVIYFSFVFWAANLLHLLLYVYLTLLWGLSSTETLNIFVKWQRYLWLTDACKYKTFKEWWSTYHRRILYVDFIFNHNYVKKCLSLLLYKR